MNYKLQSAILSLLITSLVLCCMGCSRENPVTPDSITDGLMPAISDAGQFGTGGERQLQGIWSANLTPNPSPSDGEGNSDFCGSSVIPSEEEVPLPECVIPAKAGIHLADSGSAGVPPANITPIRTADFHLNVRPFIATPKIYVRSWNPSTQTVKKRGQVHFIDA